MSDSQDKRQKLIAKIKALLAKTEGNGCSEFEALAAMETASRLMAEHDLTYKDIEKEVRDEKYGARTVPFATSSGGTRLHDVAKRCAVAVARFFDCKVYINQNVNLIFFGSQDDTSMAAQMMAMLRMAVDSESARYLRSKDRPKSVHGRTLRASFVLGMTERLNKRIWGAKKARTDAAAKAQTTGTSLIVVKDQVVTEKYAQYLRDKGVNLMGKAGYGARVRHGGAYASGQEAGGRVDIGGTKIGGSMRRIAG